MNQLCCPVFKTTYFETLLHVVSIVLVEEEMIFSNITHNQLLIVHVTLRVEFPYSKS